MILRNQQCLYGRWKIDPATLRPVHERGYVPTLPYHLKEAPVFIFSPDFGERIFPEQDAPIVVQFGHDDRKFWSRAANLPSEGRLRQVVRIYPWSAYDGRDLPELRLALLPFRATTRTATDNEIIAGDCLEFARAFNTSKSDMHGAEILIFLAASPVRVRQRRQSAAGNLTVTEFDI